MYNKILKDSDDAYTKVLLFNFKIVKSTEALYRMVQNEEKKVKSTSTKKFEG